MMEMNSEMLDLCKILCLAWIFSAMEVNERTCKAVSRLVSSLLSMGGIPALLR